MIAFKVPVMEPSLWSTKVNCGKYCQIRSYLVYVYMQIAYIKTHTHKISGAIQIFKNIFVLVPH